MLCSLGEAWVAARETDRAVTAFERAADIASAIAFRNEALTPILHHLRRLYEERGDVAKADQARQRATALTFEARRDRQP